MDAERDTKTTERTELPEWWFEPGQNNPQIPPALLIDTSEIGPDDWDKPVILCQDTAALQVYYPELGWSKVGTVVGAYEEARDKARQDKDWARKAVYLGEVIRDSIECANL